MATNRLKSPPKTKTPGSGLFGRLRGGSWLRTIASRGFSVRYVPHLLFLVLLGLLYIANSHYANKTYRKLARLDAQVEDLRVDYTSQKAKYMFYSKQSEVARRIREQNLGLVESARPPLKIVVPKDEY
ncbi:hypothetical protein SAMN05421823_105257 [Catalinimonas alkaloidigena]|uniref:Cell division protein FtsL n=1 Tax=Catalinimonas alkaloidigena TaxID=1075417 RepID=A0A1G9JB42_9BACT|nr:FtsL-like putative cell division protein [Catalinimonas alkaloidigena]SDL34512.1 hypothetical protein SAMN05421823_105257 [Catalinimonas alkaloidigena]